jgi:hypothetical protein
MARGDRVASSVGIAVIFFVLAVAAIAWTEHPMLYAFLIAVTGRATYEAIEEIRAWRTKRLAPLKSAQCGEPKT